MPTPGITLSGSMERWLLSFQPFFSGRGFSETAVGALVLQVIALGWAESQLGGKQDGLVVINGHVGNRLKRLVGLAAPPR